jgi:ABC-type branched-subunit amino acid transport system permease subunit
VTAAAADAWYTLPWPVRRLVVPGIAVALLVLYPKYWESLPSQFPEMSTAVVMCVFIIMALGLNVVVGYAGLLDLGYVAFYAAGAYIAGWFATLQFAPHVHHLWAVGVPSDLPGVHLNVWLLILVVGAAFAALLGVIIGLPTLRLRGDYLAIVTLGFGEIIPQAVNNADRPARVRQHAAQHVLVPPRELPPRVRRRQLLLLDGAVPDRPDALLLHQAPRLTARPGVGGHP